jgi:NitT/TauT family transport system permease protein
LVLGTIILLGTGARQMAAPFAVAHQPGISLSPAALPAYTLRTVLRMLAALILSLIFAFTYATLAGKSRRAEMVLIPLLDVLPGNTLGPEPATIFAIVTSQAWNIAFSFYQALRTVPRDLDEVSRSFSILHMAAFLAARSTVCDAWFHLEHDDVDVGRLVFRRRLRGNLGGDIRNALPGVGSYVARAIQ